VSGGWGLWERWRMARRLAGHARREGGAPPPELLRRLREDIPDRPDWRDRRAVAPEPGATGKAERPGAAPPPRRWLVAASLTAAMIAAVLGLRVLEQLPGPRAALFRPAAEAVERAGGLAAKLRPPPPSSPSPPPRPTEPAPPVPGAIALPPSPAASQPPPSPANPVLSRSAARVPAPPASPAARPAGEAAEGAARPAPTSGPGGEHERGETAPEPQARPLREPLQALGYAGSGRTRSAPARRPGAPRPDAASTPAGAAQGEGAAADDRAAQPLAVAGQSAAPEEELRVTAESAPVPPSPSAPPLAKAARPGAPLAPLRSTFGDATGTAFYRRLRRELLAEGRLPPTGWVRAEELANAFELRGEAPAVSRSLLSAEGAPLPPSGAAYLVRFAARGLTGPPGAEAVQVDFDPTVVAHVRRVGATASRGGASALFEVELRRAPERASPHALVAATPAGPGGERQGPAPGVAAAGVAAAPGAERRVLAILRVSRAGAGGAAAAAPAARVVYLSDLQPSWTAASPELRISGLAVQLAAALAAGDPARRLQELRAEARALASELPDEPKAAELLRLVERAAELAGAPGAAAAPHPPRP
jgi:hypothetical protein